MVENYFEGNTKYTHGQKLTFKKGFFRGKTCDIMDTWTDGFWNPKRFYKISFPRIPEYNPWGKEYIARTEVCSEEMLEESTK